MKQDETKNTVYGVVIMDNAILTLEKLNLFFHVNRKMTLKEFMIIQQDCWNETKLKYNLNLKEEKVKT